MTTLLQGGENVPEFIKKYLDQFREFGKPRQVPKARFYITSAIVVIAVTIS